MGVYILCKRPSAQRVLSSLLSQQLHRKPFKYLTKKKLKIILFKKRIRCSFINKQINFYLTIKRDKSISKSFLFKVNIILFRIQIYHKKIKQTYFNEKVFLVKKFSITKTKCPPWWLNLLIDSLTINRQSESVDCYLNFSSRIRFLQMWAAIIKC